MNKTFKDVGISMLSNAIWELLLIVGAAVGTPIMATIVLIKKGNGEDIDIVWWIILVVFALLNIGNIIVGILQFVRRTNKPTFPAIKSDVLYEMMRTELYFADRENIKCYREVRFKVLCDKMRSIRKQFTWTGDGYKGTVLDEKSKGKNFKIDDSVRRLPPQIYDVEFDAEKKKGDRVSYRVITEVTDKTHVMQPSLSQQINSKTKKLELVLTVPRGLVKNVTSSVYADSAHKVEIGVSKKIDTKTYGEMETYEVCIKNPELLHRYFIGWEWL